MKILAIDPATHCGFAYYDGAITSGVWDLSVRTDESSGMRLLRFKGKLKEISALGIELVVFEAVRHANPKMIRGIIIQSEIQGILKCWCDENEVEYFGLSPSEIKKHITGKGNADKIAVMNAINKKLNLQIKDDNEADALAILDYAMEKLVVEMKDEK